MQKAAGFINREYIKQILLYKLIEANTHKITNPYIFKTYLFILW